MEERESFLNRWQKEAAVTLKLLRAFPPEQADFRPAPSARTARELAWIFVFEGLAGSQGVLTEFRLPPPDVPPIAATWHGVIGEVERAFQVMTERVKKMGVPHLNTTVKFLTGPQQFSDLRRMDVLWMFLYDQIHHRGQFSVYLRMVGGKVPAIYGPSGDERWM
jgi:uncharacterized damage-inducible protein DinB